MYAPLPIVAIVTRLSPAIKTLKIIGITIMPAKMGTKTHTRLIKKAKSILLATASAKVNK